MIQSKQDYKELLEDSLRNFESVAQQLEWETAQLTLKQQSIDIRFDVVPILKKLKETIKGQVTRKAVKDSCKRQL